MTRNVKNTVTGHLILIAIIPLFIFAFVFFGQIFDFFMKNDTENINSVLQREQKYITNLVDVNIKDMKLVASSDSIKTGDPNEIGDAFKRFMAVRNDIVKMKLVYNDGRIIELDSGSKSEIQYKKIPLDVIERSCLSRGEYAMYSGDEEAGQYIIFSAPYMVNNRIKAVILGYMPVSQIQFAVSDINLNAVGHIYIEDSRDNYLFKHVNSDGSSENDIELPIDNTDWTMTAKIDYNYFQRIIYGSVLLKIIIFFILVIIFIIPFSMYIANFLKESIDEINISSKSLKRIDSEDNPFYKIEEINVFKRNFNRMVDSISSKRLLESRGYVDRLTGLYTKRYIEDWLYETIASRDAKKIYFIMTEIIMRKKEDNNYENGGVTINAALREIGKVIRENIRFGDIAIRLEDEEFLIILTEIEAQRAIDIEEKIRRDIKSYVYGLQDLEINISMGISKYEGDVYNTILNSSKAADEYKH